MTTVTKPPSEARERGRSLLFAPAHGRPPDSGLDVVLVGFQDQDNLGLRYLTAAARHHGHRVEIQTYSDDPTALAAHVMHERPALVGFSLIFQYMAPAFG